MMLSPSPVWLTFVIGFVLTSILLLGCCAVFRVNSRYNCVRAEGRLRQQGYDHQSVPHNRAATQLPPLGAELIARLESCDISTKAKKDIEADGGPLECIVCQEVLTTKCVVMLPCGHRFHRPCIGQWLQRNATCPTCRRPLVPNNPSKDPLAANFASLQAGIQPAAASPDAPLDIEMGEVQADLQNIPQAEALGGEAGLALESESRVAVTGTVSEAEEDTSVTARFIRQHWQNLSAPVSGVRDNRWLLYVLEPSRTE